jgi:hypothetical protein
VNDPTATVVVTVDGVDYPAVNNGDGTWTLADNTLPASVEPGSAVPVIGSVPLTGSITGTEGAAVSTVTTPVSVPPGRLQTIHFLR